MNQQIIKYFSKFKQITNKSVNKYLNNNLNVKQYCQNLLKENPNYLNLFYLIKYFIIQKLELSICKTCNKQLTIDQTLRNKIYCSTLCANTNKEFISKRTITNMKKFNASTPLANNLIRQQIQQTNIKKYGHKASWNNPQIRRKIIENTDFQKRNKHSEQTCLAKYGVRKKQFLTIWNTIKQWKDYIIPLFQLAEYDGKSKIYKWKCTKCGNQFKANIHTTWHLYQTLGKIYRYIPRCQICFPKSKTLGISNIEKQFIDFCKEFYPNLLQNNRELIHPYELDILIPELCLAIEFNGTWYHSLQSGKDLNYHLSKTQMCQKQNYRLIHIWQDQWRNNKEEIKQKLINIFTNNEIIDYSKLLDRCWYPSKQIEGYKLEIIPPEIINQGRLSFCKCGYLKYTKI